VYSSFAVLSKHGAFPSGHVNIDGVGLHRNLHSKGASNIPVADAHGAQSVPDGSAVDLIPIADQIARGLIPRECLRDLACDPVRGRMRCDVDPDEVSARSTTKSASARS
jgi:hypothetical protein